MDKLLEQVQMHRNHIKYEQITFSLQELVNMHSAVPSEINISPDFQRLFRWSRVQQSSFIESIILEMPIPPIFFFEQENGTWDLLDGLQRLSTVIRFIGTATDVPIPYRGAQKNEDEWHYDNENSLTQPLQLLGGEYLTDLCGLTFIRLPTTLQLNVKRSRLNIYVLKRETKPMYKYEVFKRLNRGGENLEEQEIRNCSIRIIDDEFPNYLKEISKNESFVSALGLKQAMVQNAYIEELALRYFTMKNNFNLFEHDVKEFMTSYMESVARKEIEFNYEEEKMLFYRVWNCIDGCMKDGDAFKMKTDDRKNVGPFSPAVFEIISIGIAYNIDSTEILNPDTLKNKIIDLIIKAKENNLTGSGSNSRKKTIGRIQLGIDSLKG